MENEVLIAILAFFIVAIIVAINFNKRIKNLEQQPAVIVEKKDDCIEIIYHAGEINGISWKDLDGNIINSTVKNKTTNEE